MAKKFYSLEEAAEKLDMSPDQVKDLVAAKKLEQFRTGERLMFKVDQVDGMAGGAKTGSGGPIDLADTGESDSIQLSDDSSASKAGGTSTGDDTDVADALDSGKSGSGGAIGRPPKKKEDPRQATGVSVFDADEVDVADPMAQTQVTSPVAPADEELALESVGSGSGLLDLTRESDDTSLGAELLDEIYPSGEGSDTKNDVSGSGTSGGTGAAGTATGTTPPGSSGVFEGAIQMESEPSGLANLQQGEQADLGSSFGETVAVESVDPAWSGFSVGTLLGASATLFVGMFIAMGAVMDVRSPLVKTLAESSTNLLLACVGLLVISFVLGAVGFVIGKAASGKRAAV